jgi:hypothetical protein
MAAAAATAVTAIAMAVDRSLDFKEGTSTTPVEDMTAATRG